MAHEDLLAHTQFFTDADPAVLASLMQHASEVSVRRNDVLFSEGDNPDSLFVVLSGRIAMLNTSVDGRESVLALMDRGDLFGEMGMLDDLPRSATARALEPSTLLRMQIGRAHV